MFRKSNVTIIFFLISLLAFSVSSVLAKPVDYLVVEVSGSEIDPIVEVLGANINISNHIYGTGDGSSPDTGYRYEVFVRAQGDFSAFDKSDVILSVNGFLLDHDYAEISFDGEKYHIEAGGTYSGLPLQGEYKVGVKDVNGQLSNDFTIGTLEDHPKDAPDVLFPMHLSSINEVQPTFRWSSFESNYLGQFISSWAYEGNVFPIDNEFFYVWPIDPNQTSLSYINSDWNPFQPPDLTPREYNFTIHSNHSVAPRIGFEHHRTITWFADIEKVCDTVLDDFNRPDGAVGPNWRGDTGTHYYEIVNEELQVPVGGALYWKPTKFGPEQEACITLNQIGKRAHHSVMLKVQKNKYWRGNIEVFYDARKKKVGVDTTIPGIGETLLATWPMTLQAGDELGGRALADGTVEVYVNGVLIGTVEAGPFFVNKGGSIGLWIDSPKKLDPIVDDFAGK